MHPNPKLKEDKKFNSHLLKEPYSSIERPKDPNIVNNNLTVNIT